MLVCYAVTASPAQTVGPMTLSLDNSFSDSVSYIIIGNQAFKLNGGPEASTERAYCIVVVQNFLKELGSKVFDFRKTQNRDYIILLCDNKTTLVCINIS